MKAKTLLRRLPHLVDNIRDAYKLHEAIEAQFHRESPFFDYEKDYKIFVKDLRENAVVYDSCYLAFEDQFDEDIEEWKAAICESYQLGFTDFTDFYYDWLTEHYSFCCNLSNGRILIMP